MVAYCEDVLQQIESAGTEIQLKEVIHRSIDGFRSHNQFHKAVYIINMIVSLQAAKAAHSGNSLKNITSAIEFYREYRTHSQEQLF